MSAEWYETAFGAAYPSVYAHRGESEAGQVAERFAPLIATSEPVLDLACGSGRYMRAFARIGFDVYGADLSEYLLGEAARGRDLADRLVCCDMRSLSFGDAVFGAVVNMFTSFGYFDTDLDNVRVVQEVGRVLRPRGMFVLDFLNAGAIQADELGSSSRNAGEGTVDEARRVEGGGRVLAKHVVFRPAGGPPVEYVERVRLYRLPDLAVMLESARMSLRGVFGDYELGTFAEDTSPRLIICAERSE
jgi:SAM-dependent methyltransferase